MKFSYWIFNGCQVNAIILAFEIISSSYLEIRSSLAVELSH